MIWRPKGGFVHPSVHRRVAGIPISMSINLLNVAALWNWILSSGVHEDHAVYFFVQCAGYTTQTKSFQLSLKSDLAQSDPWRSRLFLFLIFMMAVVTATHVSGILAHVSPATPATRLTFSLAGTSSQLPMKSSKSGLSHNFDEQVMMLLRRSLEPAGATWLAAEEYY